MENLYNDICKLYSLEEAESLTEEQIADIKAHFGGLPKALESYYRTCGG